MVRDGIHDGDLPNEPKFFIMDVTVQDGGNKRVTPCVKLACKQGVILLFPSEEPPMLLVWPTDIQEELS